MTKQRKIAYLLNAVGVAVVFALLMALFTAGVFGTSTTLYARLYGQGLVNQSFSYGYEAYPQCAMLTVGGESRDPRAVRQAIAD